MTRKRNRLTKKKNVNRIWKKAKEVATILELRNSEGVIGRCDAKCYNAEHEKCDCVCCGKNHGKGLQAALAQSQQYFEDWCKLYADEHKLTNVQMSVLPVQMSFDEL